jgi:hypothetical protein
VFLDNAFEPIVNAAKNSNDELFGSASKDSGIGDKLMPSPRLLG